MYEQLLTIVHIFYETNKGKGLKKYNTKKTQNTKNTLSISSKAITLSVVGTHNERSSAQMFTAALANSSPPSLVISPYLTSASLLSDEIPAAQHKLIRLRLFMIYANG